MDNFNLTEFLSTHWKKQLLKENLTEWEYEYEEDEMDDVESRLADEPDHTDKRIPIRDKTWKGTSGRNLTDLPTPKLNEGERGNFKTREEAEEVARQESKEGHVVHVKEHEDGIYTLSDWYDSGTTVASFENGRSLSENTKKDFNLVEFLQENKLTRNSKRI